MPVSATNAHPTRGGPASVSIRVNVTGCASRSLTTAQTASIGRGMTRWMVTAVMDQACESGRAIGSENSAHSEGRTNGEAGGILGSASGPGW